jgi:hypothetical protein
VTNYTTKTLGTTACGKWGVTTAPDLLEGRSGTFRSVRGRPGLSGLDEILIRKSVRSGTFRSEVRDPLGDVGGGTARQILDGR